MAWALCFFCPFGCSRPCLFYGEKDGGILFLPSGAAASVTRSEPPRPIPHGTGPWGGPERRSVWRPPRTAFPDAWPPSSASSGPLAVRCCTKQSAPSAASLALYTTVNACRQEQRQAGEAQSLPCCVQPAKIQGIVPSRPGGAGLRGARSGRRVQRGRQ